MIGSRAHQQERQDGIADGGGKDKHATTKFFTARAVRSAVRQQSRAVNMQHLLREDTLSVGGHNKGTRIESASTCCTWSALSKVSQADFPMFCRPLLIAWSSPSRTTCLARGTVALGGAGPLPAHHNDLAYAHKIDLLKTSRRDVGCRMLRATAYT